MLKSLIFILTLSICHFSLAVSVVEIEDTVLKEIDPYQNPDHTLSSQTIEDASHEKINEIIQNLPGITGNDIFNQLFVRGMDTSHIVVIIDNIIVNDPSTPNRTFDLSKLKGMEIENIQVFKGSRAAMFKEGVGGVIFIQTKKNKTNKLDFLVGGGSYKNKIFSTNTYVKKEKLKTQLQASYEHSEGKTQKQALDGPSEKDQLETKQISFNSNYQVKDDSQINILGKFSERYQEYDSWNRDVSGYYSNETLLLSKMKYEYSTKNDGKISLSYGLNKQRRLQNEETQTTFSGMSNQLLLESKLPINDVPLIRLEYGFNDDEANIKGESWYKKKTHENTTAIMTANEFKNIVWTNSLRWSSNDLKKNSVDYATTPMVDITKVFQLGIGLSSSHHTPSLYQRYDPVYGNSSLKVERSKNYEIFYRINANQFKWEQEFYQNKIKDHLSYDTATWRTNNGDQVEIKGVESKISFNCLDKIQMSGSYDRTFTFSRQTKKQLLRRPSYKSTIDLDYNHYRLSWIRIGPSDDVEGRNSSHQYIDFNYNTHVTQNIKLYFDLHNLLNQKYSEVPGYASSERTFFLSLKMDVI